MAEAKQKAAAKKSESSQGTPRKKAADSAGVEKRAARDVVSGPTSKRIDRSINEGTKHTLDFFRNSINWS
jgi:hypothetical protein